MPSLVRSCNEFLVSTLTVENCCQRLEKENGDYALEFMEVFVQDVVHTQGN